ncbi:hypothetical protein NFI96_006123, partial [Prochilodus magdalenae]
LVEKKAEEREMMERVRRILKAMQERGLSSRFRPPACGFWSSCFSKLSFFSMEERLLERWRQAESLRQLRREVEREKEMELIRWRLQALMERERQNKEERRELERLRELEK